MKVVAVVHAKGRSERLPNKNLKILGDKPLVLHALLNARNSKANQVVIDSDDSHIRLEGMKLRAIPLVRPPQLTGNDTTGDDLAYWQAKNLTQAQIKKVITARNRIRAYYANQSECPERCNCDEDKIRCELEDGKEITIREGQAGKTVVAVKGINMSTKAVLYNSEGKVYGVFKNNKTRVVKVLPDEVQDKIKERIRARLENQTIELDEDGVYQVQEI